MASPAPEADPLTPAEVAIGNEIAKQLVPVAVTGAKKLWTRLRGRTILVVGPSGVGKTTFRNYLQDGMLRMFQLDPVHTLERDEGTFTELIRGRGGALVASLRRSVDEPGDYPPRDHAAEVKRFKPNCLVLVLDSSNILSANPTPSSLVWLNEFAKELDSVLFRNPRLGGKIRLMLVVMNKWDKLLTDEQKRKTPKLLMSEWEKSMSSDQKAVYEHVNQILKIYKDDFQKYGVRRIEVAPCSSVINHFGVDLIEQITTSIAEGLR